ncbi:class I SAM-dependent methyltransferase [Luteimonas sp. A501]
MNSNTIPGVTESPFGGEARLIMAVPTAYLAEAYRRKCGIEINSLFGDQAHAWLYECNRTGYRFWRPESLAGDEAFYKLLSEHWTNYYRTTRWEYSLARNFVSKGASVLEVGCGRGYFLQSIEHRVDYAKGLELNRDAIANKVTSVLVERMSLVEVAEATPEFYDIVCAFQVLEHIANPAGFIEGALRCVRPGGLLIFSTPSHAYPAFEAQEDVFDLPPHHMGHFSEETYRRIASHYGLAVKAIKLEPRRPTFEAVKRSTATSPVYKVAKLAASLLLIGAWRACNETGPNILAVMQKPHTK